jgi:hypothetical protein
LATSSDSDSKRLLDDFGGMVAVAALDGLFEQVTH